MCQGATKRQRETLLYSEKRYGNTSAEHVFYISLLALLTRSSTSRLFILTSEINVNVSIKIQTELNGTIIFKVI